MSLINECIKVIRGTYDFWSISPNISIIDACKLGIMFYKALCSGFHVYITAVIEATNALAM